MLVNLEVGAKHTLILKCIGGAAIVIGVVIYRFSSDEIVRLVINSWKQVDPGSTSIMLRPCQVSLVYSAGECFERTWSRRGFIVRGMSCLVQTCA
jgi:hypothetical protein